MGLCPLSQMSHYFACVWWFFFFFWRLLKHNSSSLFALWMLTESSFLITGKTVLKERRLKALLASCNSSEVLYRACRCQGPHLVFCAAALPDPSFPVPLPPVKSNTWKTLSRGAVLTYSSSSKKFQMPRCIIPLLEKAFSSIYGFWENHGIYLQLFVGPFRSKENQISWDLQSCWDAGEQ